MMASTSRADWERRLVLTGCRVSSHNLRFFSGDKLEGLVDTAYDYAAAFLFIFLLKLCEILYGFLPGYIEHLPWPWLQAALPM